MSVTDQREERLTYVTGLRGIAASVVALGHILGMPPPDYVSGSIFQADLPSLLVWPWLFGGQMVPLFLMLSGFALYWSEERRRDAGLHATSLRVYGLRRWWRIAPTYFAAMALGLAVTTLGMAFAVPTSDSLNTSMPVTWDGFTSHMIFLHNLSPAWAHQINPPLWSLAVEVQMYLLLPIVFLKSGRFGPIVPAVIIAVVVQVVRHLFGLEAFGLVEFFMSGVIVAYIARRTRVPRSLFLGMGVGLILLGLLRLEHLSSGFAGEGLWLAAFSSLLLGLYGAPEGGANVPTWRLVTWLGDRSYSLYAVHFPVALGVWWLVSRIEGYRPYQVAMMFLVAAPASLLVASLCYRWIEVPSLRKVKECGRYTSGRVAFE